jgi:2-dehydro-3-deoxygalactonokinase
MIAVDWGGSSLRVYRLDAGGNVLEERRSALGVLACTEGFEQVLRQQIAGWDDTSIVMAGMIGSRQGWVEVPYVNCPATLSDIAAGMVEIRAPTLSDRQLWIVPGLLHRSESNSADVLRGEEAQLCGLMPRIGAARQIVCLPGTHSKWVVVEQGRIESFLTAMTGEVFDLLRRHSLLGRLMTEPGEDADHAAFFHGMARAQQPGGLLHHLFSVRTAGLLATLQPAQLASYLSGLLIAHELLGSEACAQVRGGTVHLIGAPALLEAYALALRRFDTNVQLHGELLAAAGVYVLARQRGLFA